MLGVAGFLPSTVLPHDCDYKIKHQKFRMTNDPKTIVVGQIFVRKHTQKNIGRSQKIADLKNPPTLTRHPSEKSILPLHDWRKLYRPYSTVKGSPATEFPKKRCPPFRGLFFQQVERNVPVFFFRKVIFLKKQPKLPKKCEEKLCCFFCLWSFFWGPKCWCLDRRSYRSLGWGK